MDIPDYDGPFRRELDTAMAAAQEAASIVMEFYDADSAKTYVKGDGSPVTDADLASDRAIRESILSRFPGDAMLTEEGAQDHGRLGNDRCWIVDPIDGTAQFVARTGLFDVMIALCLDGRPVVAVSAQPATGLVQAAVAGAGAWEATSSGTHRFSIAPPHRPPRLVTSKWYGDEAERIQAMRRIANRLGATVPPILEVGYQARAFSSPVREIDAYVGLPSLSRRSTAREWDLACVDLITQEAGGRFTDCWGRLHRYNKRSTGISGGILACADGDLHERLVAAIAPELPADVPARDPADDGIS